MAAGSSVFTIASTFGRGASELNESRDSWERASTGPLILPPAAEHGDRIEQLGVVCLARAMLVEQRVDRVIFKESGLGGAAVMPSLTGKFREIAQEPVLERHLKALLRPLQYAVG